MLKRIKVAVLQRVLVTALWIIKVMFSSTENYSNYSTDN